MRSRMFVRNMRGRSVMQIGASGAAALLLSSTALAAEVGSAQVREGEDLGGGNIVSSINNPAVNHLLGWGFGVNTQSNTVSNFFGNTAGGLGSILRTEGVVGSFTQTSFESFWGMSNSGQIAYSPIVTESGGGSGLDSVFVDNTDIIVDSHPSSLPGLFWSFGSRPGITADGKPYFSGGVSATAGGATSQRGIFFGNSASPVLVGGDVVPNLPRPLSSTATFDFDYRFSALASNYILAGTMTSPTSDDSAIILSGQGLIEGGSLVQEGHLVPVSVGGNGSENWQTFDFLGVNEAGDYMITGNTNASSNNEFIFKNGQMLYREGDVIDGVTLSGDIEGAYMNENGDIAYIWDHTGGTLEALFLNDQLLLSEGDIVDWDNDGTPDPGYTLTDFTGISSLVMSDRNNGSVNIYFTADIITPNGTLEGGFCMTTAVPAPGALALLGLAGVVTRRRRRG